MEQIMELREVWGGVKDLYCALNDESLSQEQLNDNIQKRLETILKCNNIIKNKGLYQRDGILDFIYAHSYPFHPFSYADFYVINLTHCHSPMELECYKNLFSLKILYEPNTYNSIGRDLIPLSGSESGANWPIEGLNVDIEWIHPVSFPLWQGTDVGDDFKLLGYFDEAYRAYIEFIYLNSLNQAQDSYFILSSPIWLKAAECQYRIGNKELAWSLLMKSGVFGDNKNLKHVEEVVKIWSDCEIKNIALPDPTQLIDAKEKEMAWKKIIDSYTSMNAHPRAWAIIDEYSKEFTDPKGLKRQIQDDWLALVNPLIQTAKKLNAKRVVIYNQEIYPNGIDPLDVKIPWAFSEGSVEKAKAILRKSMMKAMLDNELRTWRSKDGKFERVAKFVSADETSVTLEQEDGKTTTVELSKLSEDDREYIKLRLEAEKEKEPPPSEPVKEP